jgi:hypothetical protein
MGQSYLVCSYKLNTVALLFLLIFCFLFSDARFPVHSGTVLIVLLSYSRWGDGKSTTVPNFIFGWRIRACRNRSCGCCVPGFAQKGEIPQTAIWESFKCFLHNQSPPAARGNPQTGSLGDFAFCAQPRASDFSRQNKHYPKLAEQGGGYNTKRANKDF